MTRIHFIAIGANLPGPDGCAPQATCAWAASVLARQPGVGAPCLSRWFSAAPVPASAQPRYINGILRFVGDVSPVALLGLLQAIERDAGRVRGAPDAARTLDLDIIAMGDAVRDGPDPILPHPRAHLRAFVLLPLRDVAPDWVHPRSGAGIGALVAGLPAQDIRPV
jgi:2-amino-4-hydroxy-6-hydroxymethyldihydropteridine diphosphokinase